MNPFKGLWQTKDDAAHTFNLDMPLLALSPQDFLTMRHTCEGIFIVGETGSGKTSASGLTILKAFLDAGYGMLYLCTKAEDSAWIEGHAKKAGRGNDLVIFSPENSWCFDFYLHEQVREGRGAGQTENLVNIFSEMVAITEGRVETSNGDSFWPLAMRQMLRCAIDLLLIAYGQASIDDICRFIAEAPESSDQVGDEKWQQESFCAQTIKLAEQKAQTAVEVHSFVVSSRYWLKEYPGMSSRTRSSIVAQVTSCADILQHGEIWRLLCSGKTNITPEMTYTEGKIIILDLPLQTWGKTGKVVQGVFKYMFQRAILRRNVEQYPRPVALWIDESQNHIGSYDFLTQATARSARLASVYLTQSISNFFAVLGANGREATNAILGSLSVKIFHANSDSQTNQYASELIAQHWGVKSGGGFSTNRDGRAVESSSNSGNWSEQLVPKVLPAEFTTLRKGGPPNWETDAIVFQGGRVFKSSGDTYLKTVFKQEKPR